MAYTLTANDWNEGAQNIPNQNYQLTAADWNSAPQISPATNPAAIAGTANNPLTNFALGALGSVRNFAQDIADLPPAIAPSIFPRGQFPQVPQAQGISGIAGNIVGNIAPFLGGGELLDAARGLTAASDLPIAATAAKWLGGEIPNISARLGGSTVLPAIARQTIGGGIYGGITNPEDREMGAIKGAAISAPLAGAPFLPSAISKFARAFKPQALTDQINAQLQDFTNTQPLVDKIVSQLSSGESSLENSGKSLAQNIKNSYEANKQVATNLYNEATANFGDKNIYPAGSMGGTLGLYQPLTSAYPTITKDLSNDFSNDLTELHNAFLNKPTFNNAHELRKQLNSEISQYYKPGQVLDKTDLDSLSALQKSKGALDQDIDSFMQTQPADIANQYNEANNYFANNVAPYRDNRQIFQIAQGNLTNPRNVANIFKNPEPEVQKVVSDLPDDAKNRILYSMLGKTSATKSPENLINSFNNLDQQGLGSYISPSLRNQIEQLKPLVQIKNITQEAINSSDPEDLLEASKNINKQGLNSYLSPSLNSQLSKLSGTIARNKAANMVGGGGIGALLGHVFGIPHLTPEVLALGAGFIGNKILPPIYNSALGQSLGRGISQGIGATYSPLSAAIRANLIPGGQ